MEKFDFYKKTDEIKLEASDILNGSWGHCAKQMSIILVLCLLIVGAVVTLCVIYPVWYVMALSIFFGTFLLYVLFYGCQIFTLNLASKLKAKTMDLFLGFPKIFKLFILFIEKIICFVFGLVLLIYNGFKFELAQSMSSYCLFQLPKKTSPVKVLKESSRLMKGNKKRLMKLRLANVGYVLLSLTVIGGLWAVPYLLVSKAIFYNDLKTPF